MSLWFPYAQMQTMQKPLEVIKADGAYIYTKEHGSLLDGVSSWWCVIHGYNHPVLNQAAIDQLSKMSHVMMGGLTHQPAQDLSNKLVEVTPEGLNHVFFGDSGSVGVEIALKMAAQYWINKGVKGKKKYCSLKMGYHGDTLTAMSVGDPEDSMHHLWDGVLREQFWIKRPVGNDPSSIDHALFDLEMTLQKHGHEIAAFICEPILQCWGGFNNYDSSYLNQARKLCDHYNVLLIFDEVATGFGRTGKLFATEHTNIIPDIMILSKALTGGYMGLSATLATNKVYDSFLSEQSEKAFMHGPTFMGNPLACSVALASIDVFIKENYLEKIQNIESIFREQFQDFNHKDLKAIRTCGTSLCLEVYDSTFYKGFQEFAAQNGVWLRPFENYIYSMPSYIITEEETLKITNTLKAWFEKHS